jgi:hypothetical protein
MAVGSTQSLTEISSRNLHGGKKRPAPRADNLAAICETTVQRVWEPRRLTTLWAFTACSHFAPVKQCHVSVRSFPESD